MISAGNVALIHWKQVLSERNKLKVIYKLSMCEEASVFCCLLSAAMLITFSTSLVNPWLPLVLTTPLFEFLSQYVNLLILSYFLIFPNHISHQNFVSLFILVLWSTIHVEIGYTITNQVLKSIKGDKKAKVTKYYN